MKSMAMALAGVGLFCASAGLQAAVTTEQAKALGATLTQFGAERAGNKEGTIPEYTGGVTTPPAGFDKAKGVRPDPFADEKPQFSISAKNMAQYVDKLTEGAKTLMKTHPDFRIDVYPTHRSVAYPKFVLENTVKNATRAKLSEGGLGSLDAHAGIPFPIPANGNEVILNTLARYQGVTWELPNFKVYTVDNSGRAVLGAEGDYIQDSPYYADKGDAATMSRARASYFGPARRAGESVLVLEPVNWTAGDQRAWSYLPGQRRVRLAPEVGYDTPNASTSGMSTYDDALLFNGRIDRFDWKLVGKKEMYVPYNDYRLTYHNKPEDALGPKFINPDVVRWELHRVWVVEATLKEGKRHVYSRRTFYIDEDGWMVLASDQYDGRGKIWRLGFQYMTPAYDALATHAVSGHYDVISGGYYIHLWPGAGGVKITDSLAPASFFTPDALAGQGVR